jgi:hypothetical protein
VVIPAIEARAGQSFRSVPLRLGGSYKRANNHPPAAAFAGIPNKRAQRRLAMRCTTPIQRTEPAGAVNAVASCGKGLMPTDFPTVGAP